MSRLFWSVTGNRQTQAFKRAYLAAVMRQEVGWFDTSDPVQLPGKVTELTEAVQKG
eukprot:SAG11_NODE_21859_length_417_cov_0.644654_1_plen_55_part_10